MRRELGGPRRLAPEIEVLLTENFISVVQYSSLDVAQIDCSPIHSSTLQSLRVLV